MFIKNYLLIFFFFSLLACNKENKTLQLPQISEFKLEASLNNSLTSKDIIAQIKDDSILFSIPQGFELNNVIPTYIANTDDIIFKNAYLKSGKSTISILNNDVIKVKIGAIEKTFTIYIVTDENLHFTTFSIEKSYNSFLKSDILFSQKEDSLIAISNDFTSIYTPSFTTSAEKVLINNEEQISGVSPLKITNPVTYTLISKSGFKKNIIVKINYAYPTIPHIYIHTVNNAPVNSKDIYLNAGIEIEGYGTYQDYKDSTQIKGRGNSTWSYAKKPYRLKLKTKASLLGLSSEKDWVLLANYLDPTLMLNATALKLGSLLEVPFTNHTIPVELTINGVYLGAYTFTEQVEVESNRVNVKDGVLFELDSYFDEDYKFRSSPYNLPVNIKYPDLTSNTDLEPIKNKFNSAVTLLSNSSFPNNNYLDFFDSTSYVNYMLVYWLTDNRELNHPKSSYMHLKNDGKYYFGPIWDFDWAYGYESTGKHFLTYNTSFFSSKPLSYGSPFFKRFLDDPKIKAKIKKRWNEFRNQQFTLLTSFVIEQSNLIYTAYDKNNKLWHKSGNSTAAEDAQKLIQWLNNRANYLDTYIQNL